MNISPIQSPVCGLRVASIGTGLICLAHVARMFLRPSILIAGHALPMWISGGAIVVLAVLSWWFWKLSVSAQPPEPPKSAPS